MRAGLNHRQWLLEVCRTGTRTLQSVAWMLLVFFTFALTAYLTARGLEARRGQG